MKRLLSGGTSCQISPYLDIEASLCSMQIAEQLGIENASERLTSEELQESVLASDQYAKQDLNIHGVPHFLIGNGQRRIAMHGAQSIQAFEQALIKQISALSK